MGTIVNVELLVENKAIVNEKILSQTKGYIQNYKVNSEEEKNGLLACIVYKLKQL